MPRNGHHVHNYCGYVGRLIVFCLAITGVLLSYFATDTCEFLTFDNARGIPWEGLEEPFNEAIAAKIGIFSYQITNATSNGTLTIGGCLDYDDRFGSMTDSYEALAASQFCAVVAPSLAVLAMVLNVFEFCLCDFFGSFIFSGFLYVAASSIQAGTFSMLAEPAICFEDDSQQDCTYGPAALISGAAMGCYFFASLVLCCSPRPDPFCKVLCCDGDGGNNEKNSHVEHHTVVHEERSRKSSIDQLPNESNKSSVEIHHHYHGTSPPPSPQVRRKSSIGSNKKRRQSLNNSRHSMRSRRTADDDIYDVDDDDDDEERPMDRNAYNDDDDNHTTQYYEKDLDDDCDERSVQMASPKSPRRKSRRMERRDSEHSNRSNRSIKSNKSSRSNRSSKVVNNDSSAHSRKERPKRKPRKGKNTAAADGTESSERSQRRKSQIDPSEFLEDDVPPPSASHVEKREKSFPDGSREVQEITHYHDGSTSVKTKKYKQ